MILVVDNNHDSAARVCAMLKKRGVDYIKVDAADVKFDHANAAKRGVKGVILCDSMMSIAAKKRIDIDSVINDARAMTLAQGMVPVLGICFGMHLLAHLYDGRVVKTKKSQKSPDELVKFDRHPLFANVSASTALTFKSGGDIIVTPPKGFNVIARNKDSDVIAAIANETKKVYGIQFYPDQHILLNFVKMCGASASAASSSSSSPSPSKGPKDVRNKIINRLKQMRDIEKANNEPFKVRAYSTVIAQFEKHTGPITCMDDVDAAGFKSIGSGIRGKIDHIITKGVINGVASQQYKADSVKELCNVYGIGPVKAESLYSDHDVKTVADLREKIAVDSKLLNDKQMLGLKYYEDLLLRIPRKEMDKHKTVIDRVMKKVASLSPSLKYEIAGSYRRGVESSGDIDLIMSYDANAANAGDLFKNTVNGMMAKGYIIDDLAYGEKKFMGVCKLPAKTKVNAARRIDVLFTEPERYPFAILYFTGSQEFNINMRNIALEQGYTLNEYGIKGINANRDAKIPVFKTEKDIFKFLNMQYVPPAER
jgi:DNA polymerase beta